MTTTIKQIIESLLRRRDEINEELSVLRKYENRKLSVAVKKGKPSPNKGYKYPAGKHWTQRPENKERLSNIVRSRHAEKKG